MHAKARRKARNASAGTPTLAAKSAPLRFYGDEFIFDTVSGMFYRVSPTASFILRSLRNGTNPSKVADEVQKRYGIERAAAVRDIELLRNDLTVIEPLGRVRA